MQARLTVATLFAETMAFVTQFGIWSVQSEGQNPNPRVIPNRDDTVIRSKPRNSLEQAVSDREVQLENRMVREDHS
jgi:hypothetical protein